MLTVGNQQNFSLSNFEGPLDLLLYLVQKNELDIYDIPIMEITEQYLGAIQGIDTQDVDGGAEFLEMAATLLLIKSKMLLPKGEQTDEDTPEDPDPRFEIIHQLLDYCRFKQLGKELIDFEERQNLRYYRGVPGEEKQVEKRLGVEHLALSDLESVFQTALERAASRQGGQIDEEMWRVRDKVRLIRQRVKRGESSPLTEWFSADKHRWELIVTFLAILELMKVGLIGVRRSEATQQPELYVPTQQGE